MPTIYFILITFLISVVIGLIAIPRIVVIARAKRLFDTIDERKVHVTAIPRLGGISFFPGAMFSFALALGFRYYFGYELSLSHESSLMVEMLFMMTGLLALFFIGITDDLTGVNFKVKFLVQTFAASTLVLSGLSIASWNGLLGITELPLFISALLTIIIAVFIINTINLIDGIDGLCSGTSSIALIALGSWYAYMGEFVYAMFAAGILGVVLVFFKYNVSKKRMKIFMGDTGSLTLGYMIVFLGLKFISIDTNSYPDLYHIHSPLVILLGLLFVPIFDTMRVFISRISRGNSPFHPDKTHIHHKLLCLGFTHIRSTMILLAAQCVIFALTIILSEILRLNINLTVATLLVIGMLTNMLINKKISILNHEKK